MGLGAWPWEAEASRACSSCGLILSMLPMPPDATTGTPGGVGGVPLVDEGSATAGGWGPGVGTVGVL